MKEKIIEFEDINLKAVINISKVITITWKPIQAEKSLDHYGSEKYAEKKALHLVQNALVAAANQIGKEIEMSVFQRSWESIRREEILSRWKDDYTI